ncbi:MAG: hypothetical protein AAF517_02135 [Planctomycetota bacterium]
MPYETASYHETARVHETNRRSGSCTLPTRRNGQSSSHSNRYLSISSICLLLILCVGCSSARLSKDERDSIRSISFAENVVEEIEFSGGLPGVDVPTRGEQWYAFWITAPIGVVLDLVDWSSNAERRGRSLQHRLAQADIDVPQIVETSLRTEVGRRDIFPVHNWGGDARVELEIRHGLDDGMGFRGAWAPWVEVEARLVHTSGDVLWTATRQVASGDSRLGGFIRPFSKPEGLKRCYRKAARLIAEELVDHLEGR